MSWVGWKVEQSVVKREAQKVEWTVACWAANWACSTAARMVESKVAHWALRLVVM